LTDIAIRVEKLGKRYQIGQAQQRHDTLSDVLAHGARDFLRRNGHADDVCSRGVRGRDLQRADQAEDGGKLAGVPCERVSIEEACE
jgi:hypothetical protein